MFKQVLLMLALTCCGTAYSAGIYKWSDNKGNTQYTATPPPHGVGYKLLAKQPQSKPGNGIPQPGTEQNRKAADTDTEQAMANASDERKARWAENCKIAQKNLEVLQSDRDVVQSSPEGEKTLLDSSAREQAVSQAKKDIEYYCQP